MAEVQNIDPKRKLFNALSNEKYYTKSYEDFDKQFSTPESVGKLYSALNKGGYYTKTQKDFEGTFFPKSNEVSTQGSKNTSQISTEPSLISQSNPFGKVPTVKTINVTTGKVGTEKVSSGSTKASKSLYADALLAVQSPIQTTSDLLTKGLGKVADGIFGEPRKTLRDRILEADTPNTTNKVGKAYDAEYLKTVSETSQANQLADNIEKSGQPKAKEIASGIRERNKQWFNLPVSERKEIREFDKSVNEEKNLQNLEAFNAEQEKLTNEIWQEEERLKNTVSGVGSRKDFQKLNLLNNRLNELKVKQATLELKPQLLKSQIFKNDDEIIQNLGEELEVALENIKENDPSKYERFSKKLKFGLSSVSEGDKKDLIREALAIKQENLANNYNQLDDSGAIQMVNNYVKEVAKYNTAVESGDEQTVRQSEQLIKTYKEAGVDGVIDNINYLSTEEEHINDIVKTSDVKYDIFSDQRRQKEVDKFVKDNPTLGRLWEAAKSVYSIIPKTVKSGAAIGSEIGNIISRDSEASRKMVGVQKFGDFIEALTPTMAELKVVNKDGSVNYNNIPTATAETLSTMAVLLLGGSKVGSLLNGVGVASKASSSAGLIASSFALSKQDYYETGIKEGLKSKDATLFANQSAMLTSLLELISPNDLIVTGKLKSEFTKEFVKYFTKNGFKYAMWRSTKRIAKEILGENAQETSQMIGDKFVELAYNRTNKTNFKENIDANELKETVILTTAATGILTGINNKSANKQEKQQYLYEASKNLNTLQETLKGMKLSESDIAKVMEQITPYNKAHNAMPQDLDEETKKNVVPLLVAKQKLQDDANQENIDPAFKTAINEKIKIIDQTIVGLVNGKFDPKKVVITDDPKEAVKNTEEAILEGSNVVEEIGLEEGIEIPMVETTPSKVETTQDVKITEEVTTPTEVKSTEKVIVEVGNVEYETDGTYVSEKGSGNLMPLDSDVSVKVLEKYSEIKPTETKVEEVKVTEDVKTTPVEGVSGGATEGVTPTLTPTQETVQVKPKFTIKGEQVTPKIEQVVPNAVQEQESVPQSEEVEVSGIKKSLVSKEVVDKVDFDKISDKEFTELGRKLHETGEVKSKDIVKEIVGYTNKEGKKTEGNRRALQPSEVVALLYYKTDLDNQERDLLKKKNSILEKGGDTSSVDAELNEVQDNIFDFYQMALITADQQSLAFRLRKGLIDKDYNYVTQVEKYKATNKGVIPADVEAKFKEYDARLKELKEEIRVAEERARIAEEQIAVNNIVEDVKRSQKTEATKRKRAEANLQKAKDEFSEFLRKSRGQANSFADVAGFAKKATKLIKAYAEIGIVKIEEVIAEMRKDYGDEFVDQNIDAINTTYETATADRSKPYIVDGQLTVPSSYIRGLVKNGTTDINELSQAVLDEVKKDLPDATIREVRDAITKYGKTVNQTADAIRTQINQAKSLGKLYSKLEDLQKGIVASKTATRTTKLTKEQIEIKKQIKVLEDALPKTEEQIEADNTKRLEAKKRYYKKFIEEKQQRLKDKNFAPKPKNKPIIPDDELSKLEAEANNIRAKYEEAHFENEQLNRSKLEKIGDALLEATAGVTRGLQAGLDLSPFGVQLAIYTATQRPDKVVRTFKDAFKFFKSEKFSRDFYNNLPNHPLYNIMKASGLALNYPNSRLGSQDYQLSGSAINKLWNFTVTPIKWVNQPLYERAVAFNPYRASERFFAGAVDMGRIQMFEDYVNTLRNDGISFENSQEQYKRAAGAVNNLTFRGDLQKAESYSKFLSTVLFAPRKIKATFEIALNPYYYWKTYQISPTVAKKQMLTMLQFLITASTTVIAINKLQDYFAGEDDDDEVNPDIFNIYSSDFMVARLGNTRLDLLAGMRSQWIALARLITGNYKTTSSSKMKKLGQDPMTPTRAGVIGKFALNKVSPIVSLGYKALDESKGKELDWDDEAVETISPLWTGSLEDIHREHPREVAFLLDFLTLVGQSVNNYGGAEFLDKDKDKKLIGLIGRKNAAFQNKSRASIKIVDNVTGEERGISKTEYQVYKKEFGEYVKEELQSRYKEFDEMPILQFEKELKNIKTNAKEYAEFSISNTFDDIDEVSITENGRIKKYTLTPEQVQERVKMNKEWMRKYGNDKVRKLTKTIEKRDKISGVKAKMEASLQVEKIANIASQIKIVNRFKDKKIKLEIKE